MEDILRNRGMKILFRLFFSLSLMKSYLCLGVVVVVGEKSENSSNMQTLIQG